MAGYETAEGNIEKRAPSNIARYLTRKLEEEKRKNPLVTGGTYSNGKLTFRYAPDSKKTEEQKRYQEWVKTRLWWARQGVYF